MSGTENSLSFNVKLPNHLRTTEEKTKFREQIEKDIADISRQNNIEVKNISHTENFGLGEVLLVLQIAGAAIGLFCNNVVPIIRKKYVSFPECPKPSN